jgi:hypothetical protein
MLQSCKTVKSYRWHGYQCRILKCPVLNNSQFPEGIHFSLHNVVVCFSSLLSKLAYGTTIARNAYLVGLEGIERSVVVHQTRVQLKKRSCLQLKWNEYNMHYNCSIDYDGTKVIQQKMLQIPEFVHFCFLLSFSILEVIVNIAEGHTIMF